MTTDPSQDAEPTAPETLPQYLREGTQKQPPEELRALAEYAHALAEWKEAAVQRELDEQADLAGDEVPDEWRDDEDEWTDQLADARADGDVPAGKGSLQAKSIDGRDYWYLQWREGDKIKSKYVAPVSPAGE